MKQISIFDQLTLKVEDRTHSLRHYEENSLSETNSKQIVHLVYNLLVIPSQSVQLLSCNKLNLFVAMICRMVNKWKMQEIVR